MKSFFHWFESRIDPYPDETRLIAEQSLWRFVLSSLQGVRRWLVWRRRGGRG